MLGVLLMSWWCPGGVLAVSGVVASWYCWNGIDMFDETGSPVNTKLVSNLCYWVCMLTYADLISMDNFGVTFCFVFLALVHLAYPVSPTLHQLVSPGVSAMPHVMVLVSTQFCG